MRAAFLCRHSLFSRPVARQVFSAIVSLTSVFGMGTGGPSRQSTPTVKKKPDRNQVSSMLALPIFPVSHPTSIFGACELNFCVRYGNRWTLTPINTNYSGCTLKTEHQSNFAIMEALQLEPAYENCRSSPRLISISQLHTLRRFHL